MSERDDLIQRVDGLMASERRLKEELKSARGAVTEAANELEQIVGKINNDPRHESDDPCLVCESNDAVIAVVEKLRQWIEQHPEEK